MSRFVSELLDLSRLPPPNAISAIDYEATMAERLARLVEKFEEDGIDYDGHLGETDLSVHLQEVDNERELLAKAAVNDALRSVLLAFATGASLDHLAALLGVRRLDGELDAALRRRVHLAPDAYGAAGSEGGYIYWALTSDVRVSDAVALGPSVNGLKPGQVHVIIATESDAETDVLEAVSRRLFAKDVKPLTDMLTVRLATRKYFDVSATIEIKRGPDPSVVLAEARSRLDAFLADKRSIGGLVAHTGIAGALHVRAAERVIFDSPTEDIVPGADGLAICRSIDIKARVLEV